MDSQYIKRQICIVIGILCILWMGFNWGKSYTEVKYQTPPESGQNYKVYINDNGEVLIRTDIKYITNDKDENIIILKESRE